VVGSGQELPQVCVIILGFGQVKGLVLIIQCYFTVEITVELGHLLCRVPSLDVCTKESDQP